MASATPATAMNVSPTRLLWTHLIRPAGRHLRVLVMHNVPRTVSSTQMATTQRHTLSRITRRSVPVSRALLQQPLHLLNSHMSPTSQRAQLHPPRQILTPRPSIFRASRWPLTRTHRRRTTQPRTVTSRMQPLLLQRHQFPTFRTSQSLSYPPTHNILRTLSTATRLYVQLGLR
jgi:hypothetical protein